MENILIRGEKCSGKSTLLKHILLDKNKRTHKIVYDSHSDLANQLKEVVLPSNVVMLDSIRSIGDYLLTVSGSVILYIDDIESHNEGFDFGSYTFTKSVANLLSDFRKRLSIVATKSFPVQYSYNSRIELEFLGYMNDLCIDTAYSIAWMNNKEKPVAPDCFLVDFYTGNIKEKLPMYRWWGI